MSVDGVSYYKDMTAQQLLWMAERFLKSGIEAMNAEKAEVVKAMESVKRQKD